MLQKGRFLQNFETQSTTLRVSRPCSTAVGRYLRKVKQFCPFPCPNRTTLSMAAESTRPESRADDSARIGGLQRTLTGVGGVRLIEMAGVQYPERVLRARPGYERSSGEAYREAPPWGISTRHAARLLGCSDSAARDYLHRHRVRFRVVAEPGRPCCNYWQRSAVLALVKERGEIVTRNPERLMVPLEK